MKASQRAMAAVVVGWAVLATGLAGCAWKGHPAATANTTAANLLTADNHVWHIEPVRMRVYPTTRFVREGKQGVLEARIEMFDAAGDPTKGVGTFHFELRSFEPGLELDGGKRLYTWDVPMVTLAQNRRYYDPVTDTYLFRLEVDNPAIAQKSVLLVADFTGPADGHLEAKAVITGEANPPVRPTAPMQ